MTTQPTSQTPASEQPSDLPERVSRLEGASEQMNLRFSETMQTFSVLREENRDEHRAMREEYRADHQTLDVKYENLRTENQAGHDALYAKIEEQGKELRTETARLRDEVHQLRAEMHRQTFMVVGLTVGLLGSLMTVLMAAFRFIG